MNSKKVWFVTGTSKGLGLSLVKKLLENGYPVAATTRNVSVLNQEVGNQYPELFLPLEVDLQDEKSIQTALTKTIEKFGKIDVVVNNAGYGIGGSVEELTEKQIRDCFEINVFSLIKVTQLAMPYFRKQKSGHFINISSIAGFDAAINWGIYSATKYAVMGLSEVMAIDVKEFGVHVTVVAPGGFKTDFLSPKSIVYSGNVIEDYKTIHDYQERAKGFDGLQKGNPGEAARVFIELAENPNPPVRLYLGTDAFNRAKAKVELLDNELNNYKEISLSTDFKI